MINNFIKDEIFGFIIDNSIIKKNILNIKENNYKIFNLNKYYECLNYIEKNKLYYKLGLPNLYIESISKLEEYPKGLSRILNEYNIKLYNNIIKFNNIKHLSFIDNNIKNKYNINSKDILFKYIIESKKEKNNKKNKKNENTILHTVTIKNIDENFSHNKLKRVRKYSNVLKKILKKYKQFYIGTYEDKKTNFKVLPSMFKSNINNLDKIKNIKYDIAWFHFKKLYYLGKKNENKNNKNLLLFKNFKKVSLFALKNINKNGSFIISTYECFHKYFLNYICYLSQYFEKIIIMNENNIMFTKTFRLNIFVCCINYNGKKILNFDIKKKYNNNYSILIKNKFHQFIQNNVNNLINNYSYIKKYIGKEPEEIYLDNLNNFKLFLYKNGYKENILLDSYFSKYNKDLLFDLDFYIASCMKCCIKDSIKENILNIYYLEYNEYMEYLTEKMKLQYGEKFKYIKYDTDKKILKNSILFINFDWKVDMNIIKKFDFVFIPKKITNFFNYFKIKEQNKNFYLLVKNDYEKL